MDSRCDDDRRIAGPLHGLRAGLLVLALAAAACGVAKDRSPIVSTSPLHLTDDDFWNRPERTTDEIADPYIDQGREVLLLDAPQVIDLGLRRTAPTQVLRVASFDSTRRKPFASTAVIVASDLVNNLTQAARAIPPPVDETAPPAPPREPSKQQGTSIEAITVDLRETLDLPWEPGRYAVRLIVRDEITAPRFVELKAAPGFVDPEVEKAKAQARLRTQVPALVPPPGEPGVSFARDAQTPPLPEGNGIRLAVPRVCMIDGDTPCLLRGSFRLPLLKRHLVPPGPPRPGTEAIRAQFERVADTRLPLPSAVVPITLVGSTTAGATPAVWRLVLPVFDQIEFSGEQPRASGVFTLDLRRLQGFALEEQTWFLYAFSDESVAGPSPVGLTRRPRTP